MKKEKIMTVQEFANLIGVTGARIRELIKDGKIKILRNEPHLISPSDNEDLINMHRLKKRFKKS